MQLEELEEKLDNLLLNTQYYRLRGHHPYIYLDGDFSVKDLIEIAILLEGFIKDDCRFK